MDMHPRKQHVAGMTCTLKIEHAIVDFDTWKAAFERDPVGRERSGSAATACSDRWMIRSTCSSTWTSTGARKPRPSSPACNACGVESTSRPVCRAGLAPIRRLPERGSSRRSLLRRMGDVLLCR